MYEFKHPVPTTPKADPPAAAVQPQPVVQHHAGQDVVVLKFCRCGDCRRYDACPVGSDDPGHWLYCAMYRGPLLNNEYVTAPLPPRGAGKTSPSVVRGHAAAVGQAVHEEGRTPACHDEGGRHGDRQEHPTAEHSTALSAASTEPSHRTPPVGPRANDSAAVEHVAKRPARVRQGPNMAAPSPPVAAKGGLLW